MILRPADRSFSERMIRSMWRPADAEVLPAEDGLQRLLNDLALIHHGIPALGPEVVQVHVDLQPRHVENDQVQRGPSL